jgi:hypothetical protein
MPALLRHHLTISHALEISPPTRLALDSSRSLSSGSPKAMPGGGMTDRKAMLLLLRIA